MTTTGEKILANLVDLKDKGNGSYRSNSPLRPDSDSLSFSLTIQPDGEHGMYQDFVTSESGSLYDLARLLGIEIESAHKNNGHYTTKRGYTGLDDYARQHGVDGAVFRAAGWREAVEWNRPCLVIPTSSGDRMRFIDGNHPAFASHKGYKTCWYGLKKAVVMSVNRGVFVLTNGEASTVVAQHYGVPAACMTNSGERSDMTPALLKELLDSLGDDPPTILIAYDSDKKGRQAAPLMEAYLQGNGLAARTVDLGLFQGGDLADYCTLHQEDSLERLLACKQLQEVELSSEWDNLIVPLDYLDTLPPPEWLIAPYIERGGITTIYGRSGAGKSFLALDLAMRLGLKMNVIYVIGEALLTFRQRKEAWLKYHECKHNLTMITKRPLKVLENGDLDGFIIAARKLKPGLIIIDTLARAMVGFDENSTRDMGLFMDACDTIRRETGAAVILVHHTSKMGEEERGSYALRGASDIMLKLSVLDDLLQLESNKQKSIEDPDPAYFRREPVEVIIDGQTMTSIVLVPAEKSNVSERVSPLQKKILAILDEEESLSKKGLADMLGNPINSIGKACWSLVKQDYVEKIGKSEFQITDKGREILKTIPRFQDSNDSTIPKDSENPNSDGIDGITESWNHLEVLPRYRVRMQHVDLENPENTHFYLGVADHQPKGWDDKYQIAPDRFHDFLLEGLPIKPITDLGA